MKVGYHHGIKETIVHLDESEAARLIAFLNEGLGTTSDPEADTPTRLEDALRELFSA